MILKLPLGIIWFTRALVLLIVAIAPTLMPLAYLIDGAPFRGSDTRPAPSS